MKNKYIADDYMNRTMAGKIHDAFEKQKQLAAQGKQKSRATSVPRSANKMATTAAAGVTAGAAQRGYTVTGLNSSEPAYRKALKQKTEKTPQSVVTAPPPPELPQPVPQPTPPAAPAASVAPTPVGEATPSPAKAEPEAKASIAVS